MVTARRLLLSLLALAALLLATPDNAHADTSRYAAFVVDENSGVVLHSRRSEAARYPASLTKMMTLYLLFDALDSGRVSLDSALQVQPASWNT